MEGKINFYADKVLKTIATVYVKKNKKEIEVKHFMDSNELKQRCAEIGNLLLVFCDNLEKQYLISNNIPLFEIEIIYNNIDNVIIKNVNFVNIKPDVNKDEELFKQLQYSLMQIQLIVDSKDKIGRNELCPCGNGRKYKVCHGNI